MSAPNEPGHILTEWLRLTREEAVAIQFADWAQLKQIQDRKAALRGPFAAALRACGGLDSAGGAGNAEWRLLAGRIVSLLTRNEATLAAQWREAKSRQESLEGTKRNLKRIQHSYQPRPAVDALHSYS